MVGRGRHLAGLAGRCLRLLGLRRLRMRALGVLGHREASGQGWRRGREGAAGAVAQRQSRWAVCRAHAEGHGRASRGRVAAQQAPPGRPTMTPPAAAATRDAFAAQAAACRKRSSPLTGLLCEALGRILDHSTEVGRRVLDWPGRPDTRGARSRSGSRRVCMPWSGAGACRVSPHSGRRIRCPDPGCSKLPGRGAAGGRIRSPALARPRPADE
jgi:hypothetical protein